MDVECPVDSCDYSGPVESVEAHISGSTRGEHSGLLGRNHREELVGKAEATSEASENPVVGIGEAGESGDSSGAKFSPSMALLVATLLLVVSAVVGVEEEGGQEEIVQPEQRRGLA